MPPSYGLHSVPGRASRDSNPWYVINAEQRYIQGVAPGQDNFSRACDQLEEETKNQRTHETCTQLNNCRVFRRCDGRMPAAQMAVGTLLSPAVVHYYTNETMPHGILLVRCDRTFRRWTRDHLRSSIVRWLLLWVCFQVKSRKRWPTPRVPHPCVSQRFLLSLSLR